MKPRDTILRPVLLALALAASFGGARAEMSLDPSRASSTGHGGIISTVLFGGGDDPGPVPWGIVRAHAPSSQILNPGGDDLGDGSPRFAIDPTTGAPVVVWARHDGNDWEIVRSRWDGQAWTPVEALTDDELDQTEPRLHVDGDGTLRVSYWQHAEPGGGDHGAWLLEMAGGTQQGTEVEIVSATFETGVRSDVVATADGTVHVAYEEGEEELPRAVIAATRAPGAASFDLRHQLGVSDFAGDGPPAPFGEHVDVEVRVATRADRTWVSWIQNDDELAYSVHDPMTGTWSQPETVSYAALLARAGGEVSLAREMARMEIRRAVTLP
jgi:hypothetical protein